MLLFYIVIFGFLCSVVALYYWNGIIWSEVIILAISSGFVFSINLKSVYENITTDQYLETRYVTSLIHRPSYFYTCGKTDCYEPERWIVEQLRRKPEAQQNIKREVREKNNIKYEECVGECYVNYPIKYYKNSCSILVSEEKFKRTKIGETAATWITYFNPVRISDEVIYNNSKEISYFTINDFNKTNRLIAPDSTAELSQKLEDLNAELSFTNNISVSLIVTKDILLFEKLKRAWHQGKANDFIIVVYSSDDKKIENVNILAWNNYALKDKVSKEIMYLSSLDTETILAEVGNILRKDRSFVMMDFSKYNFLDVKIPIKEYIRIIIFQIFYFGYMLTLFKFNPNTKDYKLTWKQVSKMWSKKYRPPSYSCYLHPLAPSGIFLYVLVPLFFMYVVFVSQENIFVVIFSTIIFLLIDMLLGIDFSRIF